MKRILQYLTLALLLSCCQSRDHLGDRPLSTVYFVFDTVASRSLVVNDEHISNCCIMVYDQLGDLVASSYNNSGVIPSLSFACDADKYYKFYCVCNIGDITGTSAFRRETYLANYQYSVGNYTDIIDSNGAVPMSGSSSSLQVSDGMNVYIDLTRCVALVTIRIDESGLQNASLEIESLRLKNVPTKVGLFSTSAADTASDCASNGDYANTIELAAFNSGESLGFYMFENCQGNLLPYNHTCAGKYFSSGNIYEDICSYVELTGYYDDPSGANPRYGDFTYRFYLGGDNTSDFSLVRNHHYYIVVRVTDGGVDETSWRVEEDLTPYATSVSVTPSSYTFSGISGTCNLNATVLPASASQTVTWTSSNPSVATVSASGVVTPAGYGTAIIKATATDGSGVYGTSTINVVNPAAIPVSMEPNYIDFDEWLVAAGSSVSDFEVTIHYSDGSSRLLTGAEALATVDTENSHFSVSNGKLIANNLGGGFDGQYAELYLEYMENSTYISFTSDGSIFIPDDLFTYSVLPRTLLGSGERIVQVNVPNTIRGVQVNPGNITIGTTSGSIETVSGGYRIKASHTADGPLNYVITGSMEDDFYNIITKYANCTTDVYIPKQRYYQLEINTSVRDHMDTSFGSQEEPDKVSVRCYLICTGAANQLQFEYFYPASYDQNGDLTDIYFYYTWFDVNIVQQMQDYREYRFNYDRDGNELFEGYCVENGHYIYYEPFN
ncbi:MAG: DUF4906 domain-containing protein [Bacteroidales bacterium]|nr:DUF4906 domain-containing protein [Bacteroidales bacterium]